jgi:site-specific recombinase XerC
MLAALRGVLKAAFKLGLMTADHMTRACSVAPVRGSPHEGKGALDGRTWPRLVETCNPRKPGGARNAALLGLAYGAGLRRAEVVGLDRRLRCRDRKLVVRGKGNRERAAWVTNGSREALDAWLAAGATSPVLSSSLSRRAARPNVVG